MSAFAALLAVGVALIVAFTAARLIVWAGPVDPPRERGSHDRPTPTSGGLGMVAGTSLGLLAFAALAGPFGESTTKVALTVAFAGMMGLIGALDDLYDLGARAKLLAQSVLALGFAVFVARIQALPLGQAAALPLGPVIGALGTALWIVVATNAVNFMDGANGLAPGAVAIALAAFAVAAFSAGAPLLGGAALAGAAAGIGFLPWNLKGRLFQGDTGALFSSALFAGLAVVAAGRDGHGPVFLYFAPLALLPMLTDVLLTLLSRAERGEPLFEAHREHLYQLWLQRSGGPHLSLAWRAWLAMAASAAIGLIAQDLAPMLQPLVFAAAVGVWALSWYAVRRRLSASAEPGLRTNLSRR